jgi:hypothetical protein
MSLFKALKRAYPTALFTVFDSGYIDWRDNIIKQPTQAEVDSLVADYEAHKNKYEYRELRASEYPDFIEYIDGIVKGDSEQVQSYIDACNAVKNKYPKG